VHKPMRSESHPMRVEISEEQCSLEEDEAGNPDRSGTAEDGQQLPGRDGLNKKKQE